MPVIDNEALVERLEAFAALPARIIR